MHFIATGDSWQLVEDTALRANSFEFLSASLDDMSFVQAHELRLHVGGRTQLLELDTTDSYKIISLSTSMKIL